jgi:hypothetical protein
VLEQAAAATLLPAIAGPPEITPRDPVAPGLAASGSERARGIAALDETHGIVLGSAITPDPAV